VTDDQNQELPQRSLPRISIAWMIGLTTLSALFMLVLRFAYQEHAWARILALVVITTAMIFLWYAVFFIVGNFFHAVFRGGGRMRILIPFLAAISVASTGQCQKPVGLTAPLTNHGMYPDRRAASPYLVSVATDASPGLGGYRQIFFEFTPAAGTFQQQHLVRVSVQPGGYYEARVTPEASQTVELKQGDGVTTAALLLPNMAAGEDLVVRIYEDGELLSKEPWVIGLRGQLGSTYSNQDVTIGIIDPAIENGSKILPPDTRTLTSVLGAHDLPEEDGFVRLNDKQSRDLIGQVQTTFVQYRMMTDLTMSKSWLAYSDLDIILVAGPTWDHLRKTNPECSDAILQSIAAGNHLWIYGLTRSSQPWFDDAKPIEASLVPTEQEVVDLIDMSRVNDNSSLVNDGWNGTQKQSVNGAGDSKTRSQVFEQLKKANQELPGIDSAEEVAAKLRKTEYGLGSILFIDEEDPFPGSFQFWMAVPRLYPSGELRWLERHGNDIRGGNTNYWRWLIPSVGGPPVKSFLFLNTVFALTVGPIAYTWLRRKRRLFLLYFLAPLAAILVTIGLFGYAIIGDGLKTKAKIHQVTFYDSKHQASVSYDRQTYYAALGNDELSFKADAMVSMIMPVPQIQNYSYDQNRIPNRIGHVDWTEETQIYSGEFLPTRSQVQYAILTPSKTVPSSTSNSNASSPNASSPNASADTGMIQIVPSADQKTAEVVNNSPTRIREVYYQVTSNQTLVGRNIAPGESAPMSPTQVIAWTTTGPQPLLPPVEFVPRFYQSGYNYYGNNTPSDNEPLLDDSINAWQRSLPTGHWIGIADADPSRYGAPALDLSPSLHVILGR
jgi:hypothetical protein